MTNFRKGLQFAIIGISFIIFKRTHSVPLKLALFLILVSLILQEFLYIFNRELKNAENSYFNKVNKNQVFQIVFVAILQLLLIGALYYLSYELWKGIRRV